MSGMVPPDARRCGSVHKGIYPGNAGKRMAVKKYFKFPIDHAGITVHKSRITCGN
jgi:hypothetical protein